MSLKKISLDARGFSQNRTTFSKCTVFVCSLNFLFAIIGYPLVMALLSPFGAGVNIELGENAFFTYPYRIVQLLVAGWAFFLVRSHPFPKVTWKVGLLGIFWGLYFTRAFWDLVISPPYGSPYAWDFTPGRELYYICYVFLDFLPLLPILKGWEAIDFNKTLKWILVFGFFGLLLSSLCMQTQIAESWSGEIGRVSATQMLHTQALGGFGCFVAIVAFWTFFNFPKLFWKVFSVFVGLLAVYMMIKAGSRGPVFGFAVVVVAWFSIRNKNAAITLVLGIFAVGFVLVFQDVFVDMIEQVSPTMAHRMRLTLEGGDTGGREALWIDYWRECLRNPLFGFQLERLGHPHCMIIDGFMMFGLLAGGIVSVAIFVGLLEIINALRRRVPNAWWILLLLASFTQVFTQSGFSKLAIQAPLLLLFISQSRKSSSPLVSGLNKSNTKTDL